MKYLITGANSFLGKNLCLFLEERKIEYTACVRGNPGKNQVATGDLTTFEGWDSLLQGIDVVVHTAGKAHDMSNSEDLKRSYIKNNVDLTKSIALAAKRNKVGKFIFISSIKVNGEFSNEKPFSAEDTPNPTDAYGRSKYLAEQELLKLHQPGIFEVIIIRPCLIYGKGVKANFESLISLVKKQLPLPFGSVHNKRSFVSVNNLSDLVVCCATSPMAAGQVFLVSDDHDMSLPQLIAAIGKAMNIRIYLIPVPVWLLNLMLKAFGRSEVAIRLFSNLQVDIAKTKNLLNWKPPFESQDELSKMLN